MRQLLHELDSRELSEWLAFARIESFGDERADLRNAITCSMIAASAGVENPKPANYMPFPRKPRRRRRQSVAKQIEVCRQIAAMFPGIPLTATKPAA